MKKLFTTKKLLTLILIIPALILSACTVAPAQPETQPPTQPTDAPAQPVRIAALKGPTAMGLAGIVKDDPNGECYTLNLSAAPDAIPPLLVKGEVDIACIPGNLAAVLYNRQPELLQMIVINTVGVLYLTDNGGTSVKKMEDLKGKTIVLAGKGATPEYALNYILDAHGIDPADVKLDFKSEHAEAVAALAQGKADLALMPQPFVTVAQSKNPSIRVVIDMNTAWEEAARLKGEPGRLVMGVAVARRAFIEENPVAVRQFLADYAASQQFVTSDTAGAAAVIGEMDIVPQPVAVKALPYCGISNIAGAEMQTIMDGFLAALFAQNPQAVGGALPPTDFYFTDNES